MVVAVAVVKGTSTTPITEIQQQSRRNGQPHYSYNGKRQDANDGIVGAINYLCFLEGKRRECCMPVLSKKPILAKTAFGLIVSVVAICTKISIDEYNGMER